MPFKAAIAADVASIMTAHILIPALDEERPATLSPAIVDGLLKQKLGFDGLVLSDDLEMKAISGRYGHSEATVQAIARRLRRGADVRAATRSSRWPRSKPSSTRSRKDACRSSASRTRWRGIAASRSVSSRRRGRGPPTGAALRAILGRDEHQAVAAEMARFA